MESKNRKQISDLKIVLKDFEPMVKDPQWLIDGKEIANFSLRPREAWANWLICAVLNKSESRDMTFAEAAQEEGDGFLVDRAIGQYMVTEHILAFNIPKSKKQLPKGEERVIKQIERKIARGPEYAKGKTLVVLFDGAGIFYRQKIREAIRDKHHFDGVYAVGLLECSDSEYRYSVTQFKYGDSITHAITINGDFTDWKVSELKDTHRVRLSDGAILASWVQEFPL